VSDLDATDPVSFVRATPPFDALPAALFEGAFRTLEIGFYPGGTWLVRAGGTPLERLYLIRRGSVRLEREGQPVQVLEEGETFGYTSLITRQATLDVVVEEDLLAYELPGAEFERLRSADAAFAGHFAVGLADRLRRSLDRSPVVQFQADLSQEIGDLVRRPAVWVDAGATVGDAARLMRAEGVSSVLVRGEPPGIVTDRDFANRVLAAGLGPGVPVAEIATRPVRTLGWRTPMHDAWTSMLDWGYHHVAVTRDGPIAGVVTANDLLKASAQGPMAVLRRVERLPSRASLPGYATKVAEMDAALLAGGLDAAVIAQLVSRLNDALLGRVLAWAEADLGPAPAPWAWVALGSDGRREQALLTDQDNGLVWADEGDGRRDWFLALAERVNADLEAAGFPPCPHGHDARREHGSLSEWRRRLERSVDERRPLLASLLFDLRKVGGPLDLAPLDAAAARAQRDPAFLRHLARAAVEHQPHSSLGLRLRGAVEADLKAHGIVPVVYLARCYGLEVGTGARSTLERLEAAAREGLLSEEAHESVTQAYRFLIGLRLRHQLRQLSDGETPTSVVRLADLSAIERSRLKDAFRAVRRWQERAAFHYRTDFF
jgi:CBS domain-containing protein